MRFDDGWWVCDGDVQHPVREQGADVGVIASAMRHVTDRRLVVQAGARVGLWPVQLAQWFNLVLGFEPEKQNYECAVLNSRLHGAGDVRITRAALGEQTCRTRLARSDQSSGMHYVSGHGDDAVPMIAVDDMGLDACGAVFLDVEGYELHALRGARETLARFHPVVVAEENELCGRYARQRGDVELYLRKLGYERVGDFSTLPDEVQRDGAFHGSDLIFAVPQ